MTKCRLAILAAGVWALLPAIGVAPAFSQSAQNVSACLTGSIAALRLIQIAQTISNCDQIIDDAAAPPELKGQARGQRGLLLARRWAIVEKSQDAFGAIDDITEGLRIHTPTPEKRQRFLLVRGQLYIATGQLRRAADDFKAVLAESPNDDAAKAGLRRAGTPNGY